MVMRVRGGRAVKSLTGSEFLQGFDGKTIKKMRGDVKCLDPEGGRKVSLRQERTDHVSNGANHALSTTVLLRRVRTSVA